MKRNIYIVLSIIMLIICFWCFKILQTEECVDEYVGKQWYLQKNFKGSLDTNNDEQDNYNQVFGENDQITINSNLDLGMQRCLENGTQKKDKHITIALIDSCVDVNHEDLHEAIWNNKNEIPNNGIDDDDNGYIDDYYGWNFITNSSDVNENSDAIEHGTHCAGIMVAKHNNIGIQGILGNYDADIMVLPVLDNDENQVYGTETERLSNAIKYAEMMGASICNISCTFSSDSKELKNIIQGSNMYFVVAAGNYNSSFVHGLNLERSALYPASYNCDNIITVASINCRGELSGFSNYGSNVIDICAPGEYIYSTLSNDRYGFQSGTSMATPIITSIVAAYYLNYDVDISGAVSCMYDNALISEPLIEKTGNGRIVCFK